MLIQCLKPPKRCCTFWDPESWMDARQMMTTRSSDTQTQTSSQDTQPAGLPHTLSGRTHHSRPRSPCHPPQHPRCQGTNNSKRAQTGDSKQTQTSDRGQRVRLKDCSASSNLAGREARTRPCVGSCEASMDALLSSYPPTASPNSHSYTHGWEHGTPPHTQGF